MFEMFEIARLTLQFTEMAEECQNAFLDFIKEVDSRKA